MGFLDPKPQTTAGLDAAVTAKINTPGSATATALSATILDKTGIDPTLDVTAKTYVKVASGDTRSAIKIRNEGNNYALRVEQTGTDGVHDATNIIANFPGAHTAVGINAGNTDFSTVKVTNDAAQIGGQVIAALGTNSARSAGIIGAHNPGSGPAYVAIMKPAATGIGFQVTYEDAGAGTTTYSSRALWIAGHHTGGSLAYIENDKIQTSGNLLQLVQSNASASADCLVISPFGTGVGLRINASGASTLIAASNFAVDSNGTVRTPQLINNASFSNARISLNTTGTLIDRAVADGQPVLTVQNNSATSTGDLMQYKGIGSSSIQSRVDKNGYFMTRKNAAPADADLANGEQAIWLDSTNGAAKLMVKAKQADGTVRTGSVALA